MPTFLFIETKQIELLLFFKFRENPICSLYKQIITSLAEEFTQRLSKETENQSAAAID